MVNNVCKYSMYVNLLTGLIKPRLIFYVKVTPLKINRWKRKRIIQRWKRKHIIQWWKRKRIIQRWKRKRIIQRWDSPVLQGRNFHACRIEHTVMSGRHCLPLAALLLLHLSSCWS